MKSDLTELLKYRFFICSLLISIILRIILQIFFLPTNTASSFAPDEATYANLAKYVSRGLPVEVFPGYGPTLYNIAKTFIVPSSALISLGLNEFLSVRLISNLFGLLANILLGMIFIATKNLVRVHSKQSSMSFTLIQGLLITFIFFPSNFLWSNLALRETSSQFTILSIFYLCIKLYTFQSKRLALLYSVLLITFVTLSFGSRRETALVFLFCAILWSLFVDFRFKRVLLTTSLIIGFFAGQIYTTTPQVKAVENIVVTKVSNASNSNTPTPTKSESSQSSIPTPTKSESSQSSIPTPSKSESSQSSIPTPSKSEPLELSPTPEKSPLVTCPAGQEYVEFQDQTYKCVKKTTYEIQSIKPLENTKKLIEVIADLPGKRDGNRIDAQSALPKSRCDGSASRLNEMLKCNLSELPFRFISFMFRPFPLFDSGSDYLLLAGIENLLWLVMICIIAFLFIRDGIGDKLRSIFAFVALYFLAFSTASSLYEGNLGTAFRHKSSILWTLLFLIFFLREFRKSVKD